MLTTDDLMPKKEETICIPKADALETLHAIHWTQLRTMVRDAGGEYTGKEQAIEYLKKYYDPVETSTVEEEFSDPNYGVPIFDEQAPYDELITTTGSHFKQDGVLFDKGKRFLKWLK
jgi:hypothetical protein